MSSPGVNDFRRPTGLKRQCPDASNQGSGYNIIDLSLNQEQQGCRKSIKKRQISLAFSIFPLASFAQLREIKSFFASMQIRTC
jgi:hypothetical protein